MRADKRWLWSLCLLLPIAHAGGSYERVTIRSFVRTGDTGYVLVVVPAQGPGVLDPFMGGCATFTVRGDFKRLEGAAWLAKPQVSKDTHVRALEFIGKAAENHLPLQLGWMGGGFTVIRESEPCVVESRALELSGAGSSALVISYFNAV